MDYKEMTNEENYHFDVTGYLIVPGVLTPDQLNTCNEAIGQLEAADGTSPSRVSSCSALHFLRDHPVLMQYLEETCGENFRLDRSPHLIEVNGDDSEDGKVSLSGGSEWQDWSRAYRQHNGSRFCQGLRAIWALADVNEDDGGLVVVPASHNSSVDAPQDLVSGDDDMRLVVQPVLQAGDLLLCTESLIWGLHQCRSPSVRSL